MTDDSDDANSETASGDPSTLGGANRQRTQLDFGDKKRTEERYKKAVLKLEESLKVRRANWETFEAPKFDDTSKDDPVPELREQINKILEVRKAPINNQDYLARGKRAIERGFKAMSPFAKNFLRVAKEGQSVIPDGFHR